MPNGIENIIYTGLLTFIGNALLTHYKGYNEKTDKIIKESLENRIRDYNKNL